MPVTDSIVRPSFLLKSTLQKVNRGDSIDKVKADTAKVTHRYVSLKDATSFKLSDIHLEEEGYFKGSKYFKLDKGTIGKGGILGDPVPYTFGGDNTLAGILLLCFLVSMGGFSVTREFFSTQLHTFFGAPRSIRNQADRVSSAKVLPFLILQTSLFLSVICFIFQSKVSGVVYEGSEQLVGIGFYLAEFVGYFLIKRCLYGIVDWTFFDYEKNKRWTKAWAFLTSMEGVLLFPLTLLLVYFNLSVHVALIYAGIVVVLVKILQLYKSYSIFFKRMAGRLQIILYFCSLEIIPLMVLGGVLYITGNYLEINI